jgi:regulation of enolase protein 1 (concanavalin A-like superfamily)
VVFSSTCNRPTLSVSSPVQQDLNIRMELHVDGIKAQQSADISEILDSRVQLFACTDVVRTGITTSTCTVLLQHITKKRPSTCRARII